MDPKHIVIKGLHCIKISYDQTGQNIFLEKLQSVSSKTCLKRPLKNRQNKGL